MDEGLRLMSGVEVHFCGEVYRPDPQQDFIIGRDGDLILDEDNTFLHRHFLAVSSSEGLWWLVNVGGRLSATVADSDGSFQGWLAPGARLPLVFPRMVVWFTAGPTTYDFEVLTTASPFSQTPVRLEADGAVTLGPVALTSEQKLLLVALCEGLLRDRAGGSTIPQSAELAGKLGWSVAKFNRKLDAICEKLADAGVRGLRGGQVGAASSRKARLAEYAMAGRLVAVDDLALLGSVAGRQG